jgi:hypothetical protein
MYLLCALLCRMSGEHVIQTSRNSIGHCGSNPVYIYNDRTTINGIQIQMNIAHHACFHSTLHVE